jgi:2-desacetyl-2-hydroxyethyl bacteriochlorophyllide A dehydrogenase
MLSAEADEMQIQKIVFAHRGVVRVETTTLERSLQPTEVLIETACSLVSAGTELAALSGTHSKSDSKDPPAWLRFPSVPGYLACGRIVEAGADVMGPGVGQRVVAEGPGVWNSHCSHLIMEAADEKLVPIPERVCFEEAVTTKLGSIAMTALRVLKPQLGDSIAVMGLGLVGQMAARLSLVAGAGRVVGVDPVALRRAVVSRVHGIEAIAPGDPLLAGLANPLDGPSGFDHVIEASGHPEAFLQACRIARTRGKIAILSSPHRFVNIRLYDHIHSKGLQILGAHGSILSRVADANDPWTDGRQRRLFMRLLAEKRIDVSGLITHRAGYEQAPQMYRGLLERPEEYLGVLFHWNAQAPWATA